MRVAEDNVDVRMEIPGAVIRQRKDFGDVSGFDKLSSGSLARSVARPLWGLRIQPSNVCSMRGWPCS